MLEKQPDETRDEKPSESRVRADRGSERRLSHVVRAFPEAELANLMKRLGIRIDPAKRLDVPSQVARVLVGLPEVRDPSRLAPASHELLIRIADAGGFLRVAAKPPGLEQLMSRGILYAWRNADAIELMLPHAFLLQVPTWPAEDPRSLRALIAQASFETTSAIAAHYLGRPCTPPIALALEPAWDVLSDEVQLRAEIDGLAHVERKLLEAIEALGGEVETAELLDLEREPIRLRNAKGVSTTRRGAGFALERRAFLIPVHPNRHVIPSEVSRIVGAERRAVLASRQTTVQSRLLASDHLPRRATFAKDPSPLALAVALWIREASAQRDSTAELKASVGVPRSLITRVAQNLGQKPHHVGFVTALARAIGLLDVTAAQPSSTCGALPVSDIQEKLFRAWLNGAVWDEARADSEVLRAAEGRREPSPTRAIRDAVLDALQELPSDRWFPYLDLEEYVRSDPRSEGTMHLLRRWAERQSVDTAPVTVLPLSKIVVAIVLGSLAELGLVDVGIDGEALESFALALECDPKTLLEAPDAMLAEQLSTVLVRTNARGRRLLSRGDLAEGPIPKTSVEGTGAFKDKLSLVVGPQALVGHVLSLSLVSEVARADDELELVISSSAVARAIARGATSDEIRDRVSAVAPLPPELSDLLKQASVVVGKGSLVGCAAFLWVDDPDVREMLRTARTTSEFFLDPSPPSGLLVAPAVDLERVVRRARGLGVEIELSPDLAMRVKGSSRGITPPPMAAVEQPADPTRSGTRAAGRSSSANKAYRR